MVDIAHPTKFLNLSNFHLNEDNFLEKFRFLHILI